MSLASNLAKFQAVLTVVSALTPIIVQTITTVEGVASGATGSEKLTAVLENVKGAFDRLGQTAVSFEEILPMLTQNIASLVALFNAIGMFRHAGQGAQT